MAESVGAVRIPPYNFSDPALWFSMCESTFFLGTPKPITESLTKYNYIVAALPPEAATIIRDVIIKPDPTDSYGTLKTELLKRCSESSSAQLRKLLACEPIGDRRPSEVLRELRRRAESQCVTGTEMELFLQQLPSSTQSILAAVTPLTPDTAADIADRIMEVNPVQVHSVAQSPDHSAVAELQREVERLRIQINKLQEAINTRRPTQRPRSRSNTRQLICWFHQKFGQKAKKCTPPCKFQKNDHGGE